MPDKIYQEKKVDNFIILKGVGVGILLLLTVSIMMALFSSMVFSLNLTLLNRIFLVVNLSINTFIGFYIARRVETKGWLNGGLGGMIYMGVMLLLGAISVPVSIWTIFFILITGLVAGSVGGILGINF